MAKRKNVETVEAEKGTTLAEALERLRKHTEELEQQKEALEEARKAVVTVERLEAERARVVELWQEARRVGTDGWARAELDRLLEPNPVLRGEA